MDLHDNFIVGYVFGHSNNNNLVFKTLDIALEVSPGASSMIHIDREYHYTYNGFKQQRSLTYGKFNYSMQKRISIITMEVD